MKSFSISGYIADVENERFFPGTIHVTDGIITAIQEENVAGQRYILPGLVDAHVHIESSMVIPSEFARAAVVHGTVATVSDPHEIANVLGIEGVKFMIANGSRVPFHFYFGAPSCVPATPFETSGHTLGIEETEQLLRMKEILYLSEMMNFPGVIGRDPAVMKKLELSHRFGKPVDGHAPGLTGDQAYAYISAGISTDHECYTLEEAEEKIRYGMYILIREGSAARNFEALCGLISKRPDRVMFCSDDKHPDDLVRGHINELVKRAIRKGFDPMKVLRCCTLNPKKHYRLDTGILRKGDPADFIIVDNLNDFNIEATYISGERVAESGRTLIQGVRETPLNHFNAKPVTTADFRINAAPGRIRVIKALDGQLITKEVLAEPAIIDGQIVSDPGRDILKIAVVDRYNGSRPAIGFVNGFGLKKGAIASNVAHDSHNIIVVGADDESIATAINQVIHSTGGIVVTDDSGTQTLPLPFAGIMSADDVYLVAEAYEKMDRYAHQLGSTLRAPFMTLSFMALLVIPEIKLSDKGLFDGRKFKFIPLLAGK